MGLIKDIRDIEKNDPYQRIYDILKKRWQKNQLGIHINVNNSSIYKFTSNYYPGEKFVLYRMWYNPNVIYFMRENQNRLHSFSFSEIEIDEKTLQKLASFVETYG